MVSCLVNRSWDVEQKEFVGQYKTGKLIAISTESKDGDTFPVGVVILDGNSIKAVPLEFITKL